MRRAGSYYGATAHGAVTDEDRQQARALGRRVAELAAPHYDVIAPVFGDPIPGAADAVGTAPTPCVICLGGGEVERAERKRLHARGIPVFPTPERGIRALAALLASHPVSA